ncbi:MAG: SH3 domain-containing protein [Firmicutes bacterium]|nr:SH3 domain-containing protein [Bacillota bacterium]
MIAIAVLLLVAIIILIASIATKGSKPTGKPSATPTQSPTASVEASTPSPSVTVPDESPTADPIESPTATAPVQTPTTSAQTGLNEGGYAMLGASGVNFRKDTNTSSQVIRKLDKGEVVIIVRLSQGDGSWASIKVGDDTGYVKAEYLKVCTMNPDCKVNVQESMNVRKEPTTSSDKVAVLTKDAPVTILRFVNSEWVLIRMSDGNTGYAMMKYLK